MSKFLRSTKAHRRLFFLLAALFFRVSCPGADTNDAVLTAAPAGVDAAKSAPTTISAQDSLRSFLEIQDQLHNTQVAIEKNRHDTESALSTNIQLIQARLDHMDEEGLLALANIQRSNRVVLIASGVFVALGFIVLLTSAALQLATIRRLASVTSIMNASQNMQAFSLGDGQLVSSQFLDQTNSRLLSMIDRLEKRIMEIESGKQLPAPAAVNGNGHAGGHHGETNGHKNGGAVLAEAIPAEAMDATQKVRTLMGKGQTLLKLDKAEEALDCLDEVLAIDPAQLDALIKKGAALERLQRFNEAIACYDMAIARDGTMTMAYLYKGAVFNRLERYSEALECYEQALKSRQKKEQAANIIFDEA